MVICQGFVCECKNLLAIENKAVSNMPWNLTTDMMPTKLDWDCDKIAY